MMVKEKKPSPLLQRIFELRRAKKINLEQIGKVMGGITQEAVSRIENGDVPLKAEYLPAVAKLLGVQPWELWVDYEAGEVGPLNSEEKTLVLNFRKVASDKDRQAIQTVARQLLKN